MPELTDREQQPLSAGVAMTDVEALLGAVTSRLRDCVAAQQQLTGDSLLARMRRDVLDFVSALDQLQMT